MNDGNWEPIEEAFHDPTLANDLAIIWFEREHKRRETEPRRKSPGGCLSCRTILLIGLLWFVLSWVSLFVIMRG